MIGYLEDVSPEDRSIPLKDLAEGFMERYNLVPGPFRVWMNNESVALRMKAHSDFTVRGTSLSQRENEIVILVCARVFNSDYVTNAHKRNAKSCGIDDQRIEAICSGADPEFVDARDQAIFKIADEMSKRRLAPKDVFAEQVEVVGAPVICEVAALFGFYATCCVSLNFCGVQP